MISEAELANLIHLTEELLDLNVIYEYDETGDTTRYDYPVDNLKDRYLNNEDPAYIPFLINTSFEFDTLISYTHYIIS